jgi:hypothetical protein
MRHYKTSQAVSYSTCRNEDSYRIVTKQYCMSIFARRKAETDFSLKLSTNAVYTIPYGFYCTRIPVYKIIASFNYENNEKKVEHREKSLLLFLIL